MLKGTVTSSNVKNNSLTMIGVATAGRISEDPSCGRFMEGESSGLGTVLCLSSDMACVVNPSVATRTTLMCALMLDLVCC